MALLGAISSALSIASSLKDLFGGDPNAAMIGKLDAILALSHDILDGVEATRKTVIATFLANVHSDIKQSQNYWNTFAATGNENDKLQAIEKSTEALADITSFAAQGAVEQSALLATMLAATALRQKVIAELQDGATSGEFAQELNNVSADFTSFLPALRDEFNKSFIVKIADYETSGSGPFSETFNITFSFSTTADPNVTSNQTVTFSETFYDENIGFFLMPYTDEGFSSYVPTIGAVIPTFEFLAFWDAYSEFFAYRMDGDPLTAASSIADLEYLRGGGTLLIDLIADLDFLTSGEWLVGQDGVNDNLFSDLSSTYTKPDTLDGKSGDDLLYAGNGNDTLRGGDGIDLLLGEGGNDSIRGGADADRIHGGSGQNLIDGGTGTDEVTYVQASVGVTVDLAVRTAQNTQHSTDTISNIENIEGSRQSDNLKGDNNANRIRGHDGDDQIQGREGGDTLDGGAGLDTMLGQAGSDTYIVDNLGDVVNETGFTGTDIVNSSVTFSLADTVHAKGNIEHLTLTGESNINGTGNVSANTIVGNGAINTLRGGDGIDNISGGIGDDKLYGGKGKDNLTGGAGADKFYFDTALSAATNVDKISSLSSIDKIVLDNDIFTGLGARFTISEFRSIATGTSFAIVDASDNIIYLKSTGDIYYDRDGSGTAFTAIKFADLAANTTVNFSHFLLVE